MTLYTTKTEAQKFVNAAKQIMGNNNSYEINSWFSPFSRKGGFVISCFSPKNIFLGNY